MQHLHFIFVSILLTPLLIDSTIGGSPAYTLPKDPFLGIAPEDAGYFRSDVIKCKDGSKKFTKDRLNDDFCDCPDGTDEPGTAACPGAKFYCRNTGHVGILLFSSRVNDGICDCCDGSDEYDGKVNCPNTCWEAGKVARDKLKKKIATYEQGVAIRRREVQQAKGALAKDAEELSKLKNEEKILKGVVQRLKERKEQIEKTEEKERLQKEKEEKLRKEAVEVANKDQSKIEQELQHEKSMGLPEEESETKVIDTVDNGKIGVVEDSPSDEELLDNLSKESKGLANEVQQSETAIDEGPRFTGAVENTVGMDRKSAVHAKSEELAVSSETIHEPESELFADQVMNEGNDAPKNTEELSKEELGRLVASRWTGEKIEEESKENSAKDNNQDGYQQEEMPEDMQDKEDEDYASEIDGDHQNYEYEDADDGIDEDLEMEDPTDTNAYSSESDEETDYLGKSILSWLEKMRRSVRNILQAAKFFFSPVDKSEAAQVRREYDELSSKLSKMQSRISSLSQKLKQDFGPEKEFYSFYGRCFEGKQNKYVYKVCPFKQASQEEGHHITRLGHWDKFEDSYRTMVFSNGEKCWNGPQRSLKVKLRCGLKNEVTDVDEPSRCEYEMLLSAPSLCSEDKLKELRHKLDLMNQQKPRSNDEL